MLHRLKLKLLYGTRLRQDPSARKKKMRVILVSGFLVYLPFLLLAYLVSFETRGIYLAVIGFFSACACIPVVGYAYAKGFNAPLTILFRERRKEFFWLALKVGFFYPLMLYFMILGIVEFLFGYSVVRAAMISFVAAAVARDGFEIGFLRAESQDQTISIFPDGTSIGPFLKSASLVNRVSLILILTGGIGFLLGPLLQSPIYQTVVVGLVGGGAAVFPVRRILGVSLASQVRLFIWPGFTMAATYFLTAAYLVRILFHVQMKPSFDFALLTAIPSAWLAAEVGFIAHLVGSCHPPLGGARGQRVAPAGNWLRSADG